MEAVVTKKIEVGSWVAGCLAALLFIGGLVYWNEYVIPRQAVDDMCEARYSENFDPTRDFLGTYGWQNEKKFYEFQKYELNKCKVAGYARLKGVR